MDLIPRSHIKMSSTWMHTYNSSAREGERGAFLGFLSSWSTGMSEVNEGSSSKNQV